MNKTTATIDRKASNDKVFGSELSERAFPEVFELSIHNIDLHYHAGRERPEGSTLDEFVEHARISGRRVVGLTDHLGKYNGRNTSGTSYEPTPGGFRQYRDDMQRVQEDYPDIRLFLAPEAGPVDRPEDIAAMPADLSDYFILEPAFPSRSSMEENTDKLVDRIRDAARVMEMTGKPAFVAHPFRSAVNMRLIKERVEPWVTGLKPRRPGDYRAEELNDFFLLDIPRVGRAAAGMNVALEVNGNTQYRIRSSNLQAPLHMLWAALSLLKDCGCELVPGSDQHGFTAGIGRVGMPVPADCFEFLGVVAEDMTFLKRLLSG